MFDFNGNGKRDNFDMYIEMKMINDQFDNEREDEEEMDDDTFFDDEDEIPESPYLKTPSSIKPPTYSSTSSNNLANIIKTLQSCCDDIQVKIDLLQDKFNDRASNEPDFSSSRYETWIQKQDEIEERISLLENISSGIDDVITDLEQSSSAISDLLFDCEINNSNHNDLSSVLRRIKRIIGE